MPALQNSLDELINLAINMVATAALVIILVLVELTADATTVAQLRSTLPTALFVPLLTQSLVGRLLSGLLFIMSAFFAMRQISKVPSMRCARQLIYAPSLLCGRAVGSMVQHLRVLDRVACGAGLYSAFSLPHKPVVGCRREPLRGGQHGPWPLHTVRCPTAHISNPKIIPHQTGIRVLEGVEDRDSPHLLYGRWIVSCCGPADNGGVADGARTLHTRRRDT